MEKIVYVLLFALALVEFARSDTDPDKFAVEVKKKVASICTGECINNLMLMAETYTTRTKEDVINEIIERDFKLQEKVWGSKLLGKWRHSVKFCAAVRPMCARVSKALREEIEIYHEISYIQLKQIDREAERMIWGAEVCKHILSDLVHYSDMSFKSFEEKKVSSV